MLFSPKDWAKEHPDLVLDDYRLREDELKEFAVQISRHRAQVRFLAEHFTSVNDFRFNEEVEELTRWAQKMKHWCKTERLRDNPLLPQDYKSECSSL